MKNTRAKRAKLLFFIVKYANLWAFCYRRRRGCLSSLLSFSGRMLYLSLGHFPLGFRTISLRNPVIPTVVCNYMQATVCAAKLQNFYTKWMIER